MADREQEGENITPPTSPTSPTPSMASSPDPSSPKGKNKLLFKSNLQVLLKKQDDELIKSIEYKKKLEEEGEEEEEEEEGEKEDGAGKEDGGAKGSRVCVDKDGKGKGRGGESKTSPNDSSRENQDGDDEVFEASSPAVSKDKGKEDTSKTGHKTNDEKEAKGPKKENKKEKEVEGNKMKEKSPHCKKKKNTEDEEEEHKEDKKPSRSPREEKKLASDDEHSKENEKLRVDESEDNISQSEDEAEESVTKGRREDNDEEKKAIDEDREKGKEERISAAEVAKTSGSTTPLASPKVTRGEENGEKEEDSVKKKKHQGTMMKKGSSPFSRSKKYFFVLDGKRLMYYHSEADYKGLSGAKGSLDLTLLEEVRIKKPGRMKTKFPFSLKGRNLKSITLATDTEEQREKWMAILRGTMEQKARLSGSENILNSSESPVAETKKEKYATLPAAIGSAKSETSSDSEVEDKVKDKVEVEEEPIIIKPKKVMRVGPGINLDLSNIKLRKIEENKEKKKVEDDETKDQNSEIFKIKLRKTEAKGVTVEANKEEQQGVEKEKELVTKKPNKQPNIPLNKSPLLAHAEPETKMLPTNLNTNAVERKRSPSPNIPLSKNVHTFVSKSTEDEEDENTSPKADPPARKSVEVRLAESREIRHSEALLSIEDATFIEYMQDEKKTDDSKDEVEDKKISDEGKSNNNVSEDNNEILQVSVTVKETSEEEAEYEELDEEFLQKMKDSKAAELTNRGSGRFSSDNPIVETSKNNIECDADASESSGEEEISEEVESSKSKNDGNKLQSCENSLSGITKNEVNGQGESGISDKSCTEKCNLSPKTETDTVSQGNLVRVRTNTNESSTSSSREDSEDTEKKVRKFKRFSLKHSGNSEQDKQEDETRDANGKRKKKSSFSKFLPTKNKEKKKPKEDRRDVPYSQPENISSVPVKNECDTRHQEDSSLKKSENEVTGDNQNRSGMTIPEISLQVEKSDKEIPCQVELRTSHQPMKLESRGSTYSRSSMISQEADPPPLVPEKRGVRSTSPGHDVPQNNRPVTMLTSELSQGDLDVDDDMKVDGMLTEDQIHAILSGKGNCNKTLTSSSQNSNDSLYPRDYSQSRPDKYDQISQRFSKISTISSESDEPLPKTDFLSGDRNSLTGSSGSSKCKEKCEDSDASNDVEVNESKDSVDPFDPDVPILRKSRVTDSRSCGPRVSLTLPEFTVMEEEGPGSPDYESNSHDTVSGTTDGNEQDEVNDYFPVIGGGDVEIRNPSSLKVDSDISGIGIRTSGINSLKAFLEENQEEVSPCRSGISRLGHSPAVERLKRESSEDSQETESNK